MTDWTIGVLMGLWLAVTAILAITVMRSNRLTQDACARLMSSLERTQASNARVETAYASWRSEAAFRSDHLVAPDAVDLRMFSSTPRAAVSPGSANGTTD